MLPVLLVLLLMVLLLVCLYSCHYNSVHADWAKSVHCTDILSIKCLHSAGHHLGSISTFVWLNLPEDIFCYSESMTVPERAGAISGCSSAEPSRTLSFTHSLLQSQSVFSTRHYTSTRCRLYLNCFSSRGAQWLRSLVNLFLCEMSVPQHRTDADDALKAAPSSPAHHCSHH